MLLQDFRYAARGLRQNPLFTIVAAASLAIGIGANTAIFTLLDQLLLRPLPIPAPQQLIQLELPGPRSGSTFASRAFSYPMYRDLRDGATGSFSGIAAQAAGGASFSTGDASQIVQVAVVTGNWFRTFGLTTSVGRPIAPDDDRTLDGHPVAVISHAFWQNRFGSDPRVLGKKLFLNGQPFSILGVMQEGFKGTNFLDPPDVYLPMAMQRTIIPLAVRPEDRRLYFLHVFARMKPGVTVEQAKSELDRLIGPVLAEEERTMKFSSPGIRKRFLERKFAIHPGSHGNIQNQKEVKTVMWLLTSLVAGVLLIACANVANLLLARSTARRREIAVRLALGANRMQLVRLVLAESLLLSLIGGTTGLLAANWATDGLLLFLSGPAGAPALPLSTTPDLRVVLFTLIVSVLTALVFGIVPAFASTKPDVAPVLKDEGGAVSGGGGSAWLRKALVVGQVALSLLLLAAASLFLTSLHNLRQKNPGFATDNLVTFTINPAMNGYSKEAANSLLERLTASLRALPAVNDVSMAAEPLLADSQNQSTMAVAGYQPAPEENMNPEVNYVGPGFLHTLGIPLLQGRDFTESDTANATPVAIVSETFAGLYFKGREPLGQKIGFTREAAPSIQVVGVVKDIRHLALRDDVFKRQVYIPSAQARAINSRSFYIRTSSPMAAMAPAIRALVKREDGALAVDGMRTMEDQIDVSLTMERFVSVLCMAFGLIATLLAGVGLYGVMAFHVARRTREIGIRMALGAQRGDVLRLVLREATILAGAGVALGIPLALALGRLAKALLFEIEPTDVATYAGSALFLFAVAMAAGFLPARRAARIDPMSSLRHW